MDDLSLWLRLWHTPGLGSASSARLLEHFLSIQNIFCASRSALLNAGLSAVVADALLANRQTDTVQAAMDWQVMAGNHILAIDNAQYPELLKNSPVAPALLFVKGQLDILGEPQLAMVGSRNPSQGGQDTAFQFARHLSSSGVLVTSGLALGIDAESHRGALAANAPTIAVVATGLDRVYPARHKALAEEILAKGGAIVSEFPLGTSPKAEHFPQRNRIIAGLSLGALVVEAAVRSGSLITARQAREAGREVFAIPGSIHNPMSKGCHALIKQGAKLVEAAEDILEELAPQLENAISSPGVQADSSKVVTNSDHDVLLEAMGFDPVTIDQLGQKSGFKASEIASMLLILELEGRVCSESGGRFQRSK